MKNNFSVFISAVLSSSVLFYACSKDDDNKNQGPTKTELISRQWIQTDLIASVGSQEQSIFDQEVSPTQQDDIYEFKADGSFILTEGATKENASDPDTITTGVWAFLENETKVMIDPVDDDPQTLTIDELTNVKLKGHIDTVYMGIPAKLTTVLQAK